MNNKTKKILFINFGGLGDEILFLPTIISVKKEFPNSKICLALENRSKGILSLTNIIDFSIGINLKEKNKYLELIKLLFFIWKNKFDMVISSGSNKFIPIFLFLTGINQRYGYDSGIFCHLFLTKAVQLQKNQYAVKMYHSLSTPITDMQTELPVLNIEKKETIKDTILIHPGVSKISVQKGMIKTISPDRWAEVINLLSDFGNKKILLVGGPDDKDCIDTIVKKVPMDKFENLYGTTKNLKELAELISSAEKFVCSDSAPLHIAVSLGVKTYVIFGSTDEKKLIPISTNVVPIKSDYSCPLRPCLWERRKTTCSNPVCLDIPAQKIVDTIMNN